MRTRNPTRLSSATGRPSGRIASAALLLVVTALSARAQQPTITPNYKDADLGQIVEAVSEITKKNFIIDPRVRAQVTMVSNTPLTADAFYEAFLAILQVHGFVAVPAGNVIKIIPDANARQVPSVDLPDRVSSSSDEIVTQVIAIKNVSAAQLVPILRPLIPQYGHLAAYPASNMLIISDRANNVNRMVRIIRRIDQAGDEEIDVIPLEHASAAEVVRVVNVLYPAAQAAEGGIGVKLVADERTNSVLVSGEKSQRLRLKTLVTHLDTPLESGGDTQVRYLRFADAEKLAAKLKEQATVTAATTPGAAPPQGGAPTGGGGGQLDRNIQIWAEPETNALIVTAPPKVMRALMAVVDKLDIRRAQVHVEAILVEVSGDKTADLGVNWLVDGSDDNFAVGGFIQPIAGASIVDIIRGIDDPSTLTGVPSGFTAGGGRISDTGTDFAVLLRALRADTNTNIIATPSVVTMDNQEAEIKIAQEVPFITGSFTQTGTDATNPFQTIQREEVGNILKITPQISEGETVILKIEQEASSLAPTPEGSVDLVTNKRTITTNVLVDDGGIIVLGGLIRDELLDSEQRVPFLGAIPLIGELFKVRNTQKRKTNFMVFIRPKILRDGIQTAIETNTKYNMLRDMQLKLHGGKAPLLPFEKGPALPPADPAPTAPATKSPQEAPEGAAEPSPTEPPVIDARPVPPPE
ncbi:MAG TPA: type II secretion system secretin GspD [Steroidobacteraceae bacterium]|nr:type II secretion system secretin GspD [Steroidobacteraceae bacterium]